MKRKTLELELQVEVIKSSTARNEKEMKTTISTQETMLNTLSGAEDKLLTSLREKLELIEIVQLKNNQLHDTIIEERENVAALKHYIAENDSMSWSSIVKKPPIPQLPTRERPPSAPPVQQSHTPENQATNLLIGSSHLNKVFAGK